LTTEEMQEQMIRFWDDWNSALLKREKPPLPRFEEWAKRVVNERAGTPNKRQLREAEAKAEAQAARVAAEEARRAQEEAARQARVAEQQNRVDQRKQLAAARAEMIANAYKTDIVRLCEQYRSTKLPQLMAAIRERGVFSAREAAAIESRQIFIGMSEGAVRCSWGDADRINRTITARGIDLQIIFGKSYVYTENGIVTAIQD
jgi:hypothetical protein